jgi:hypothetical protein
MARVTRRELLMAVPVVTAAVAVAPASGCKSTPGTSAVYLVAKGIGGAAGLVLNDCALPPEARSALVSVVTAVMGATPGPSETLTTTWVGAAKKHVESLVADGKVKPLVGTIALAAFTVVAYAYTLLEIRHPQVRAVRELAFAAVDGLASGFLATFRPTGLIVQTYDVAAYKALRAYSGVLVLRNLTATAAAMAQSGEK